MSDHRHRDRISPMHVGAGIFWGVLTALTIANIWWGGDLPWWVDALNITLFVVAEGWAVKYRREVSWRGRMVALRDTLSQFMTWFARMSKPGTRWYQSWNAATVVIAGHWAALPARQVSWTTLDLSVIAFDPAQLLAWLMITGFLLWHWLRPDATG